MTADGGLSFDAWQVFGKTFDYGGHEIFYREEGTGPALLCIHGFPTASWDWHRVWSALTAAHRVVALDMIGFGFSAKPRDYNYSVMDQADLHEALLSSLGIESVDVLAHDLGDTVAQELLARFKDRQISGESGLQIRSVCLLNGGLFPETHRPRIIQRLLISPLGGLVARFLDRERFGTSLSGVFGEHSKPTEPELDAFWHLVHWNDGDRVAHKLIRYMTERKRNRARWVGALSQSPVPVRLVAGMQDPVSGAHMVNRYRQLIPEPDVVELDDIGHFPQIEDPAAVLEAVQAFFQDS